MQLKDRVGHWCCGTFLFRAEVLHNIPLSILRRAGYKKNKWFSARSEERDSVKYFKPHALFHICFYTSMNLLLFVFVSIVRATILAVAGNGPVRFTYI